MKTLLLAALVMTISVTSEARSILVFKTTADCIATESQSDVKVTIQEAQDGQAQLILKLSVQEDAVKIQAKKVLPPPMGAGMPLKYVGKNVSLSIGTRPTKVGKVVGRVSSLTVEGRLTNASLVCTYVK